MRSAAIRSALAPVLLSFLLAACQAQAEAPSGSLKKAQRLRVKVLAEYPHDKAAFTQGLLLHDGFFYESTGQYGRSAVRRVEPTTGIVVDQYDLDASLFGEGMEIVDGRLVQLTWQSGLALVYDAESLVPIDQFVYRGEGWGLTFDGERYVMSDGSSRLVFRDPGTFEVLSSVDVTLDGRPLAHLNELEFVAGEIYANVWQDDRIVRIAPASGKVTGVIDASGLIHGLLRPRTDVLNGIAYDAQTDTFWITGKYWPKMFQVIFVPAVAGK